MKTLYPPSSTTVTRQRNNNPAYAESLNCRLITLARRLGFSLIFLFHRLFISFNGSRLTTLLSIRVLRSLRILSLNVRMRRRIGIIIYLLPVGIHQSGPHFVASLELHLSLLFQGVDFLFIQNITILIPIFYSLFGSKNNLFFSLRGDAVLNNLFLLCLFS